MSFDVTGIYYRELGENPEEQGPPRLQLPSHLVADFKERPEEAAKDFYNDAYFNKGGLVGGCLGLWIPTVTVAMAGYFFPHAVLPLIGAQIGGALFGIPGGITIEVEAGRRFVDKLTRDAINYSFQDPEIKGKYENASRNEQMAIAVLKIGGYTNDASIRVVNSFKIEQMVNDFRTAGLEEQFNMCTRMFALKDATTPESRKKIRECLNEMRTFMPSLSPAQQAQLNRFLREFHTRPSEV